MKKFTIPKNLNRYQPMSSREEADYSSMSISYLEQKLGVSGNSSNASNLPERTKDESNVWNGRK